VALLPLLLTACSQPGPSIVDLSLVQNPNPTVPLAAVLSLSANQPVTLTINIDDGDRQWTIEPSSDRSTTFKVPVIGLRAARSHIITAKVTNAGGSSATSDAMTFETPPLPDIFPKPKVTVHKPDEMEPGVTLFNVNGRWNAEGEAEPAVFAPAVIVNNLGEVIWYYLPEDHKIHDVRQMPDGNFIYEIWPGTGGMVEVDVLGNILRRWHFTGTATNIAEGSIPVETGSFHHDFTSLPNGNILLLSNENRVMENWYTSETDADAARATANVLGDVIIEMNLDGDVLREWKLHDILDPYRIGYSSLGTGFWRAHYEEKLGGPARDWTHANAIIYEEEDNSFLVSVPYQDAVIKVSMDTGELVWILGNHDNWKEPWSDKLLTPVGDLEWSYKHHAISHTENGTYLLFDNGVARSSPFNEKMALVDSYSRAVEYSVNEETMEVSQVWSYGPKDEHFYARYLGDVDWQPKTDNILITIGGQESDPEGNNAGRAPDTQRWARLLEVTHETPSEVVWDMRLQDTGLGWAIYRGERLPALYPDR
tara:strand:+ start:173 stop:1783 length:1611 start_codon:yes stop_codon:yes gene_type:complete